MCCLLVPYNPLRCKTNHVGSSCWLRPPTPQFCIGDTMLVSKNAKICPQREGLALVMYISCCLSRFWSRWVPNANLIPSEIQALDFLHLVFYFDNPMCKSASICRPHKYLISLKQKRKIHHQMLYRMQVSHQCLYCACFTSCSLNQGVECSWIIPWLIQIKIINHYSPFSFLSSSK